jgi:hypothetical protein
MSAKSPVTSDQTPGAQRPASPRKLAAARANAQKSTGPKTPEGKARSAQNAVRHGLCAKIIVLFNENGSEYKALFSSYVEEFQPAGPVEFHLVEEMVTAAWRGRRALEVETNALDTKMRSDQDYLEERYGEIDESFQRAKAFTSLSNDTAAIRLDRYQASMSRQFHRALKALLDLRKRNPPRSQQANLPIEANPISEHSAATPPASDRTPPTPIAETPHTPEETLAASAPAIAPDTPLDRRHDRGRAPCAPAPSYAARAA